MAMFSSEPHSLGDVEALGKSESEQEDFTPVETIQFENVALAAQVHENDVAEIVLVSEPEGSSISMGGLHPRASLYERPVNMDASKKQHAEFRRILRSYGIKDKFINARIELEDLVMNALTYVLNPAFRMEDLSERDRHSISDAYKRKVVEEMSYSQLIDILMINPTVELTPTKRDTGLEAKYEYQPLSNLIYTRDQQITTAKGVIMGRLQSKQRHSEVELMSYCFKKIGIPLLGAIEDPGYLEGGDFYPAGADLCFIGIGLRSNFEACQQLMEQDWLGTSCVAIVKDECDQSQDRMHLDCVFNITGYDSCIMLEDIMDGTLSKRRLVDEYVIDSATRRYRLEKRNVDFATYVQSKGFSIIPVTCEAQLKYACNVLNLGHGRIISVDTCSSREIVRSSQFHGTVQVMSLPRSNADVP